MHAIVYYMPNDANIQEDQSFPDGPEVWNQSEDYRIYTAANANGLFFLVFYVCFYCVKKVISSSFSSGLHLLHLLHIDHLRSQNHIAYVSALLSASTTSNIFSSSKRHHEVNF